MIAATGLDDGLVLGGEIYAVVDATTQFAACACTDGQHRLAGPWRHARTAAEQSARTHGTHVVHRTTATTPTEVTR